jgi:3-oxoadipate enol-lactonase
MDRPDYLLSVAHGGSNRPVLVLGHSLGTNFTLWRSTLEQLGKDGNLLRFDPHPRQNEPTRASIEARGRELLQLLDRLGINRIDFCGVSISGLLGQWLAINAPDRIHRLVLSNTAARIGTFDTWESRIKLILEKGLGQVAESVVNRWFSPEFSVRRPEILAAFTNDLRKFPTPEYLAGCQALRDADFRERVQQIRARTLIIAGTHDLAAPLSDAEFLHEKIRDSQLQVLPCGHLACIESAEAFATRVRKFLSEPSVLSHE